MGRTLTNNVSLAYSLESAPGVASAAWKLMEPNSIGAFGADISTVARDPISPTRQRRKGTVVDLDSSVEFDHDLTMSCFRDFAAGWCFSRAINADVTQLPAAGAANAAGEYTLATALVGSQIGRFSSTVAGSTLIWVAGFATSANNGLKSIDADATASTALSVAEALTDESGSARISFAGHRVAVGEAVAWAWSAPNMQATLSASGLGTLLGGLALSVGQLIHIGSVSALGGTIQRAFDDAGTDDAYGYARVVSISANDIVLDKVSPLLQATLAATGDVDILFGEFVRNVAVSHGDYVEQTYQFEAAFPNLGNGTSGNTDEAYQYASSNYCNELSMSLPLADKATMSVGFVGTDTANPTTTRMPGADTPVTPAQTSAYNSSNDIARLRITGADESGLSTDFKSLTLTLKNNVSPEKILGKLGAAFVNAGNFEVDVDAELLFTSPRVIDAIRNNDTVTMDFVLRNDDGVIAVDIPAMSLGGGGRDYPRDESIKLSTTGMAFGDPSLNTSIGVSLFPVPLP